MYEDEKYNFYKDNKKNFGDAFDLHEDFLILLVDTFNVCVGNNHLKQMTLTLICRYYSERAEFVRNISKMQVIFNQDEWNFYKWANITIDEFTRWVEKSVLWSDRNNRDSMNYINIANKYLYDLRWVLFHKCRITYDPEENKFELNYKEGERKVNKLAQRIFRNVKVYDHLIKFITDNMKMLVFVRTSDTSKLDDECKELYYQIKRVFRRCFNILEGIALSNKTNQDLLWKYKEFFTLPELGDTEQDGELEFVLAIVDKNERITTERSLSTFITSLNKRRGNQENFVKLLDIYHELMDHENSGSIKKSIIKMILESPDVGISHTHNCRQEFEASINLKEILLHILETQDMRYSQKSLLKIFPLNEYINRIFKSMNNLDTFEHNDEDYDDQDYEELRESQQQVLTDLYSKLYLNRESETYNITEIYEFFDQIFLNCYNSKLDHFLNEVDLNETNTYKISHLKLIIINFQVFMKRIKSCFEAEQDKHLSGSNTISVDLTQKINLSLSSIEAIDMKVEMLIAALKRINDDKIKEFLLNFNENAEEEEVEDQVLKSNGQQNNATGPAENGENGNEIFKILRMAREHIKDTNIISKISRVKIKDRRSKESIGWGKTWGEFVDQIWASRTVRNMIDKEQDSCSEFIYDTLTSSTNNEEDVLNVYSIKTFISNSIDYICEWEKQAWTVYITIFTFKIFSNVLKLANSDLEKSEDLDKYKKSRIHQNILEIMDTLKNVKLLFNVLSENKDENLFKDEIFMATWYFTNKLISIWPSSMQMKFEGLFTNHSGCQSFFKRIEQYLNTFSNKIKKNLIRRHLAKIKYTDELSDKVYYVDKNLEKQIIELFMNLCSNGNTFMQNYMKNQYNNSRSFNIVFSINEFSKVFKHHLQYTVTFDTFLSCLECLLRFIQGPNKSNQDVLISNDFIGLANGILKMEYHDDESVITDEVEPLKKFGAYKEDYSKVYPKSLFKSSSFKYQPLTFQHLFEKRYFHSMSFSKPSSNFKISLAKYHCLMILNTLLDGFEKTDYVYYLLRREIDPMTFRINFAYQYYFFKKFHMAEYRTNLFFRYHENINKDKNSPFIIENGFMLFFLLK